MTRNALTENNGMKLKSFNEKDLYFAFICICIFALNLITVCVQKVTHLSETTDFTGQDFTNIHSAIDIDRKKMNTKKMFDQRKYIKPITKNIMSMNTLVQTFLIIMSKESVVTTLPLTDNFKQTKLYTLHINEYDRCFLMEKTPDNVT